MATLTADFPEYRPTRHFLRLLNKVPYALYRSMWNSIWEQRGSPQETVEWSDPDIWIPQRLSGQEQALAQRIWRESNNELNPRYMRGHWYLCHRHELIDRGPNDLLLVTERGRLFSEDVAGSETAKIDSDEGVLTILRLVAERGPGWRREFLPEFISFCLSSTSYKSENLIKAALYDRLRNLIARGYVMRSGLTYTVTSEGLGYLEKYASLLPGPVATGKQADLRKLAQEIRQQARAQLAEHLAQMNAFKFEELVKFILEEIGYSEVILTTPTNDKGVDVVARIELGISSVREVVQVKRHKGNLNRPVLDQLRGSLHRFSAVRGTIITTGGFSKGTQDAAFERGAAPITLIDGEKLLDLLIEHEIGVKKQAVDYFEFDPSRLAQFEIKDIKDSDVGNE